MGKKEQPSRILVFLFLHLMLVIFSLSGVTSKMAAQYPFLSWRFLLFYGLMIVVLGVYAIGWQQVIKRLPLTTAYANRAVTIVWGIVWGVVLFHEQVSLLKLLGGVIVLVGVMLYAIADNEDVAPGDEDSVTQGGEA